VQWIFAETSQVAERATGRFHPQCLNPRTSIETDLNAPTTDDILYGKILAVGNAQQAGLQNGTGMHVDHQWA